MRLVFLILAHDRPEQTIELARSLVAAASDGIAVIHYDARSSAADHARLEAAAAEEPRIRLVAKRAAGRWGSFGLVEAPLNALREIEAAGIDPGYVILLSGACLPCRPVAALERYLTENAGREFIECADASWVGNGWRDERWQYRFWFDHRTQPTAERRSFQIQRLLRLKRRFPAGLTPRFGSQWWALTWDTCRAMLMDMARDPARLDFFRTVWIPDEMVIQTWVGALVSPGEIAGHGLTHFQFSNRGKPAVFHDDHADYVASLESFFVRKVSPHAAKLRAACLARAGATDEGEAFGSTAPRRADYQLKVIAQTWYPGAGQVFYRDQQVDMIDSVLAGMTSPYVVVLGPPALTTPVIAGLSGTELTRLGEVFDPNEVGLGREDAGELRMELGGLARGDRAIRDMHPALFLTRLRARAAGVPVIAWSPRHAPELLAAVLRDPQALVIACLPFTGDAERDRRLLSLALRDDTPFARVPASAMTGVDPARAARARLDAPASVQPGTWPDWREDLLTLIRGGDRDGGHDRDGMIMLPWALAALPGAARPPAQRRRMFEASLESCRFAGAPWFDGLARDLRRVRSERFEADASLLPGQLTPEEAALLGASVPGAEEAMSGEASGGGPASGAGAVTAGPVREFARLREGRG
ncbi:beta-1,6-N-acetylglucosaminyltransferase [Amaricoccus macauensis]|nr:beta-1,6-N-acetylglucosaminyltransferase [Amaricoccus macauensis]